MSTPAILNAILENILDPANEEHLRTVLVDIEVELLQLVGEVCDIAGQLGLAPTLPHFGHSR